MNKDIKIWIRSIAVYFSFYLSVYLQYIPLKLFGWSTSTLTNKQSVVLSAFSSFVFSIIMIIVYRKELVDEFKKYKSNLSKNIDIGFKYWSTGLIIMVVSNVILTHLFRAGGANNEQAVQTMIHSFPILMILEGGILGPFNEEIVFRKTIKDVIKNKWLFAIATFLLFGGAHVIGSAKCFTDYLYIIPYGTLGAAFALAYYDSDTVFTSATMHMFHNTVLILISIFLR